MKPTSIIFIIVSVILIIAGFITMGVASRMGMPDDSTLVPSRSGSVRTDSFSDSDVRFINIDVKNANVEIIGCFRDTVPTADSDGDVSQVDTDTASDTHSGGIPIGASKIELYNFTEGFYDYSCSGKTLSVTDNYDVGSFSGMLSFVMNFKGLRNYLYYHETSELEKTIRIYVSEDVNITCRIEEGNVTMTDVGAASKYDINVGKGEITLRGTHLSKDENTGLPLDLGSLSISVENGNVVIEDAEFKDYNVKIGKDIASDSDKEKGEGDLQSYVRSDVIECGKDHAIGEYFATTSYGTLKIKNNTVLDCNVEIKYDSEYGGITSAVPNAAGTKFTITENGGCCVKFEFKPRTGILVSDSSRDTVAPAA